MTNGRAGGWVRGLIHLHSTYSDGKSSIRGLSGLARDVYGYEYLVFTDHADCLDRARFSQDEIDVWPGRNAFGSASEARRRQ